MSTLQFKIEELEKKQTQLIREMIKIDSMVRGKFGETTRKCGKLNCHCVSGEGHAFRRIYWSEDNKPHTKTIPESDVNWIKNKTENYQRFRKYRQQLRTINEELRNLLNQFENMIISKTNQLKDYL